MTVTPSDDILISDEDDVIAITSTTYYKIYEIRVLKTGYWRVKSQGKLKVGIGSGSGLAKVYRNGSAYSVEKTIAGIGGALTDVEWDNLYFERGDLVQLYVKASTTGLEFDVYFFRLCGSLIFEYGRVHEI